MNILSMTKLQSNQKSLVSGCEKFLLGSAWVLLSKTSIPLLGLLCIIMGSSFDGIRLLCVSPREVYFDSSLKHSANGALVDS